MGGNDYFHLAGQVLDGRHRVDQVIGEGGFGVVYKGFHLTFEQPIAIKCLKTPAHFTDEGQAIFLAKFREEAKLLSRLSQHPSIVRVYDFNTVQTPRGIAAPYMVLEWLDGEPLDVWLAARRDRPVSEAEAVALMHPAIEALAFAHAQGVAHRDVKPANIFVVSGANGRSTKVLDFGIAKAMQEGETATLLKTRTSSGFSAFSPAYGAPEQFLTKKFGPTGPWTDVHALGLILTEMVTGKPALEGEEQGEFFVASTGDQRPTPSVRGGAVSAWFEAVCARALSRQAADRYRDAGELLRALDAAMASAYSAGRRSVPVPLGATILPTLAQAPGPPVVAALSSTQMAEPAALERARNASQYSQWVPPSTPVNVSTTAPVIKPPEEPRSRTPPPAQYVPPPVAPPLPWQQPSVRQSIPGPDAPSTLWSGSRRVVILASALGLAALGTVGMCAVAGDKVSGNGTSATSTKTAPSETAQLPATAKPPAPKVSKNPWITILPAGSLTLGVPDEKSPDPGFRPSRGIRAPTAAYDIQQHEVTWDEFDEYSPGTSAAKAPPSVQPARDRKALPATGLGWDVADTYCKFIGGQLPTEEQWEYAARGPQLDPNPWGTEPLDLSKTFAFMGSEPGPLRSVRSSGQDRRAWSSGVLYDMAGNAREWTADLYRDDKPGQAEGWVQEGGLTYRAVRGLPILESVPNKLPVYTAAYRGALCASGPCPAATATLLQYVGFRCTRVAGGG